LITIKAELVQNGGYLRAGRDRRQSRSVTYLGFSVILPAEYALAVDCKFAAAGRHCMASSGAVSPESLFCAGQLLRAASVLVAVTCSATGA
jgi:hypothetical protein